ncbi:class I SAM-dependent methyltransferase [Rubinisphaera italica]|uniref:Bifunctional 3-demethylubiquinone-9 3-methyltransferase/ 2-octaprenyl-6-hydroxy phenol methylase n=1 Tax=Rubinisphaera italica TaxID=2527969 RepID=A0A5C5XGL1_9PLAN|nr:class I SAM-dependent methyltransferase [Rubinisphaera italica]TWT62306.1 bifunctional 3-demethylubiquinone-9 3-methyltransferase/ 2-octaprenyl-6-hydroxy phenol methylase [Rubinisphaera italica]
MPTSSPSQNPEQIEELRFAFGKNWKQFLRILDGERLEKAEYSLKEFWPDQSQPLTFLDVGSGSGTFSLAARNLGAEVHSFDYDDDSVACTRALKARYFPDDPNWNVEQGSILDQQYLSSLGQFDIVYSWGVLHHTGQMWSALDNIIKMVKPGGLLVIALYNDQGWKSKFWKVVKQIYCSGLPGRWLMNAIFIPFFLIGFLVSDLIRLRNPLARYHSRHDARGMSVVTDIIDWIGGYPFEVATPEEVREFYSQRGFQLVQEKLTVGLGCNEFVFCREPRGDT